MRIVFVGSGAFAVPALQWLAHSEHELALVVTQPARGAGRGRKTARTPVAAVAEQRGLNVLEAAEVNTPDTVARLRSLEARLGVVVAFGQKLGKELTASTPGGFINLHASLLPKYRGAAPINWAIVRGEERTGCTVFRITERMDAGPILTTRWTDIKPEETAGELHDRLAEIGVDAIEAALTLYKAGAMPEGSPQNDAEATAAPKLKKTDGAVRFGQSVRSVVNHVRGMTPWPGAAARFEATDGRWENVQLVRARGVESPSTPIATPGTVDTRRCVAARDGFVQILEIKPSSGRIMSWQDYVNGRHVAEGDRFLTPEP